MHFITKVGSDHFSDYAINFINSSKIHKSVIYQTKETQTGTATIMVNGDTGDNVIAIYPGANMTISPDEITIQKEAIVHSDIVLVQLETNYEALQQTIRLAQKNDIPVIINPAPYNDMVNTIIDNIDYITPNETEAGLLANMAVNDIESAKCAAKIIHQKGVKNTIITLGSKGSLAYDGTQFIYSPAFPAVVKILRERVTLSMAHSHLFLQKESHWHPHCATPAHLPHLRLKRLMPLICRKTTPFFIVFRVHITNKLSLLTKSRSRL